MGEGGGERKAKLKLEQPKKHSSKTVNSFLKIINSNVKLGSSQMPANDLL